MRFTIIRRADAATEAGVMPGESLPPHGWRAREQASRDRHAS